MLLHIPCGAFQSVYPREKALISCMTEADGVSPANIKMLKYKLQSITENKETRMLVQSMKKPKNVLLIFCKFIHQSCCSRRLLQTN